MNARRSGLEVVRHKKALAERNRRNAAWNEVLHDAQAMPQADFDRVWERLQRRGSTRTRAEVTRIYLDLQEAPHVHSVYVIHMGGVCELGAEHRGCCPATPGCDHPGWYPGGD